MVGAMFVGSETRDVFDFTVERIALLVLVAVLVAVGVWIYRSRERR